MNGNRILVDDGTVGSRIATAAVGANNGLNLPVDIELPVSGQLEREGFQAISRRTSSIRIKPFTDDDSSDDQGWFRNYRRCGRARWSRQRWLGSEGEGGSDEGRDEQPPEQRLPTSAFQLKK